MLTGVVVLLQTWNNRGEPNGSRCAGFSWLCLLVSKRLRAAGSKLVLGREVPGIRKLPAGVGAQILKKTVRL